MGKAPKVIKPESQAVLRSVLDALDRQLPIRQAPKLATNVNFSSTQAEEPINRWFRYREGYSTKLVDDLLGSDTRRGTVLDPFCGAGTTILAAKRRGADSVGIDANPLSTFVARVKTRSYNEAEIKRIDHLVSTAAKLTSSGPTAAAPALSILDKIFVPEILHALLVMKRFIEDQKEERIRDFLFLAWLSSLEALSNVFKEGNGIKYRNRLRTASGYIDIPIEQWEKTHFPADKFRHVVTTYCNQLETMLTDVRTSRTSAEAPEPAIFTGDALDVRRYVASESVSLVSFSPPYANNFNYFKAHKVELWMGGFVQNYDDLRDLTRNSLRSHVETKLSRSTDKFDYYPVELDTLLELIDPATLWTPRIVDAIKGYFLDMCRVLRGLSEVIMPGGQCVMVVGNSAYGSILIPTDAILSHTARSLGFDVTQVLVARHLTTSSQQKMALGPFRNQLRESVVCLRKPKVKISTRLTIVDAFPKNPIPPRSTVYVIRNKGLTHTTHLIHKYAGRFIPHIPRWAIERYTPSKAAVILDPFCGSGTTLVEGCLAGHKSVGIDIDPLARLISTVKTTPIEKPLLEAALKQVTKLVQNNGQSSFRPEAANLEHWFSERNIRDLGVVRQAVETWRNKDTRVYNFLILCLSSIIRKTSNADNQSLKTYVSHTHGKHAPPVKPLFLKMLHEYAARVAEFTAKIPKDAAATVLAADSRCFADTWKESAFPNVELAITSPPYIKTIDYIYNQMVELFWIGDLFDLQTTQKQNQFKQRYIGTEKVSALAYNRKGLTGFAKIDRDVEAVHKKSPKHAFILYSYFLDMRSHFAKMRKVLKHDGIYVLVVGTSAISGIPIETHSHLASVAESEGFVFESQFAYEIRNRYMRFPRSGRGGIVARDSVLTLRKTG